MTGEAPLIPPQGVLARDRIAVELRNAIVHGRLQPGERLVEDRIMAWLEATRGATREAFRQLEHEGLVISYPHRGAVVVGVTADDHDFGEGDIVRHREVIPLWAGHR